MEFSFNINTLLRDEVTRIDRSSLRLETDCGLHRHLTRRAASAVTHATRGVLHAYETDQNAQLLLVSILARSLFCLSLSAKDILFSLIP